MVLKVCLHEWLSGGVSPCQGEGRGFESRLVLSMIQKRRYPLDTSFFVCSSPAGFEQFECLRSDALTVDVNFLGAVLALRIADSMDNDLLDKLMQDTWSQFRNFRIPFYNGEKPLHLRTPAESRQAIFFV